MSILDKMSTRVLGERLLEAISFLSQKGWTPATSSNFSVKTDDGILISRSGVSKESFTYDDFLMIDSSGNVLKPEGVKPSAETLVHLALYELKNTGCVLHTHSPLSTVMSMKNADQGKLSFSGYEVIKGIEGSTSHEGRIEIPIFENTQDMDALSVQIRDYLKSNKHHYGLLLAGHGLYCWGEDVLQAKRHIEVYEFLFECERLREDS